MKQDGLLNLVKLFLEPEYTHLITWDDVVLEAVAHHMADLMEIHPIPYPQLEYVQEHLMEDAWDMIRKITYGASNLRDYRTNSLAKVCASKSKRS